MNALPGILGEIADSVGPGAALALAQVAGGRTVYIPSRTNLSATHWLVQALGYEAAALVAEAFGGGDLKLPLGPTGAQAALKASVDNLIAQGLSAAKIAAKIGVTQRTVERRRAALRTPPPNQLRLL
jgi:hypothetical protein